MRRLRHSQNPPRLRARTALLAAAGALAWLALAGCSFDPRNQVADGHAGAPGVRQTLLCPMNMVVPLQPEVRKGIHPIEQALQRYLASRDQQLSLLDRTEGRELWRRAVVASKSAGDPTRAPQVFASELAETREFDVVVMPSLVVVQTRIDASISEWDGVRRVMRMSHQPVIGLSPEDAAFSTAPRAGIRIVERPFDGISGQALVASLHILVYGRDGSRVFEGRGGIDFLQEIEFVQPGKSLRYRLRPNGALFLDEGLLHEAVVEAFTPYLAPADA